LFIVLRSPLTLNEPSRRAFADPVLSAESRAPVVSSTSDEYSRPLSGSSVACWLEITWLRWLESVSSRLTSLVTWTDSVIWPSGSVRSTRWRAPIPTLTLSAVAVVKASFPAVSS
jgi:hypothetical protein